MIAVINGTVDAHIGASALLALLSPIKEIYVHETRRSGHLGRLQYASTDEQLEGNELSTRAAVP